MHIKTFRAMGTDIEFVIGKSHGDRKAHIDEVIRLAQEKMFGLESLLSRFRNDSDIGRLNANHDKWIEVSAPSLDVLLLAQNAFLRTGGFFNPFMGQVIEKLGYDVTFEQVGLQGDFNLSIGRPFMAPIGCPIDINKKTHQVRLKLGYNIDLGGIAKGWIVEQTSTVFEDHGISDFICNAGGDMVCKGFNDGNPWIIGVSDPFDQLKSVINFDVTNLAVATSGTYRRKWSHGSQTVHHILDPFLGKPVESDIIACTVVHTSLVEAEVIAKVALILGSSQGIPWLETQSTREWVIVLNSGEVKSSCN